jgi:hypothetical protein
LSGVLFPHPLRFSLAHVPQEEKYAPADLDAAERLAWAWERSGAGGFPIGHISVIVSKHAE